MWPFEHFVVFDKQMKFPCSPNKKHICVLGMNIKSAFLPKRPPGPNHAARQIRLEIFCGNPVSKSRYLSYESKSNLKTPNAVPWPECQPEVLGGVTANTMLKMESVTDRKIGLGASSPTPYKKPPCKVNLWICVSTSKLEFKAMNIWLQPGWP